MPPARLIVVAGSICLLVGAPGCGAGATKTSRQPAAAPEDAASPEAGQGQPPPGYPTEVQQAPTSTPYSSPESLEEDALEQPSSVGEPAAEDEATELDTLADANALLARANERLDTLFGRKKKSEAAAGTGSRLSTGSSDCLEACKAFASLQRAADAICRLAGETTRRCKKARAVVDENEERVATCGCEEE